MVEFDRGGGFPAMDILKKAFLFCVGVVVIACEEITKPIEREREKLYERFGREFKARKPEEV
jgi:hypothetical protein